MDLQTLQTANELYAKYNLCEIMLEYLSDEEKAKGQKFNEKSGEFFKTFKDEMLVTTHELMTKCGEQFSDLHCPEHSEQPEEPTPSEPKEPKFEIGSKVEIITQPYEAYVGVVKDFNPEKGEYYVVSDIFSMWFKESELESYTEESENPEESIEPKFNVGDKVWVFNVDGQDGSILGTVIGFDEDNIVIVEVKENENEDAVAILHVDPSDLELYTEPKFSIGDKVVITVPEYNGATATVADYNESDGYLLVDIEGYPEEDKIWFPEEVLAPYVAPENPDENGGTTTPDAGE